MPMRINGWNDKREARQRALLLTATVVVFLPSAWWDYHAQLELPKGQHSPWILMTGLSVLNGSLGLMYWWRVFVLRQREKAG